MHRHKKQTRTNDSSWLHTTFQEHQETPGTNNNNNMMFHDTSRDNLVVTEHAAQQHLSSSKTMRHPQPQDEVLLEQTDASSQFSSSSSMSSHCSLTPQHHCEHNILQETLPTLKHISFLRTPTAVVKPNSPTTSLGEWDVPVSRTLPVSVGEAPGTVRYRQLVDEYKEAYHLATTQSEKTVLCITIYNRIQSDGGQFVDHARPSATTTEWQPVSRAKALLKINQTLRRTSLRKQGGLIRGSTRVPTVLNRSTNGQVSLNLFPQHHQNDSQNGMAHEVAQQMKFLSHNQAFQPLLEDKNALPSHAAHNPQPLLIEEEDEQTDPIPLLVPPLVSLESIDNSNMCLPMPTLQRQGHYSSRLS